MNTFRVRRTLTASLIPVLCLATLLVAVRPVHAQRSSIALLTARVPAQPGGSYVSVVTTHRSIVNGMAVHATPLGMLVWTSPRPFSRDELTANTTFIRAGDILAIQYERVTSAWTGVLTGAAIGAAGLALPIVVAGLTTGSDIGIQTGDVLLAAAVGGVAGGVVGGLLSGGKRSGTLDIGASADRFASALEDVRPLCMYGVSAPDDVVRAMTSP